MSFKEKKEIGLLKDVAAAYNGVVLSSKSESVGVSRAQLFLAWLFGTDAF